MFNSNEIEKKWQKYWEDNNTFYTDVWDFSKPKYYVLDMFPYPSGDGLHVGHPEGYTATDIIARMKRMQGFNVLHPMGFDAFGLPAEQYAVKTGNHPGPFTEKNSQTFKRQLKMLGFSYDWSKEVSTSDPKFYKWTQWIFGELFKDGLAKYIDMPVNWCEELGTVLANDEVINGLSERGGYPVVKKNMKQWVIDMPSYAERLLDGLNEIDWFSSTKEMQRNWIGKSIGAEVEFKVANTEYSFKVFTTRPDTLFGATYCVLAPEHDLVLKITEESKLEEVKNYIATSTRKSDLERTELNKDKTGAFTGSYAVNPVNNKQIPIYISDYVLATYGTGAIMAVPAHDERDYEFAKKYDIEMIQVVSKVTGQKKENEFNKKSIVAVVYDPKENKYLTLNWGEKGGRLFIGGTKEDDEDAITCATREIKEETGYINFKYINTAMSINHHYYAYNKNKAFNIDCEIMYFELTNDEIDSLNLDSDEENFFKVEWVDEKIITKEVKDELHKSAFDYRLMKAYDGDGIHINSDFLNGLNKEESIEKIISFLEEKNIGKKSINYKLRDWIFARQRYWGEPIPIVHMEDGSTKLLEVKDLPLVLPELSDYKPKVKGTAPLENAPDWYNVEIDGKKGKRETTTMPGSAGSSWYFLRYIDPNNDQEFANQELLKHWLPVDLYLGGSEHAVGHLLYSRMWNNYLYDKGLVPVKEPFQKLFHQGMILGENNEKMSKSKGNVINPDDIVKEFGADTLRLYEMFMGPLEAAKPWSSSTVEGSRKFLDRVYRLYTSGKIKNVENSNLDSIYNKTVKKVTSDYEVMAFNTAIASMMVFINECYKEEVLPLTYMENFVKMLNPIAPHITEELWMMLGHDKTIAYEQWPTYDESKTIDDTFEMVVQVNGKVRGKITVATETTEEEMKEAAVNIDNVVSYIEGKEVLKIVVVPKKLVSIVVK